LLTKRLARYPAIKPTNIQAITPAPCSTAGSLV
jgi:hypothetical protein